MKKRRLAEQRQRSSALIITLLALMLLTIIVVSFMQTMSLALTTSKSYSDIRRATLAAQAGLDTAVAQLSLATGTNLAFVTGSADYPPGTGTNNYPLTIIGEGNLTNYDQMMPLVSGPIDELTNFGNPGFSNSFYTYAAVRANGVATQSIDVNTPYQFIQDTTDTNMYRASWVTMTNMVGTQATYTRYAFVVLDDSARVNPRLMTGTGTGFTNATNWYAGPQDIALTNASAELLTESQMAQIIASSNSFAYSDATLGQTFPNRADYETVKHLFTSQTNASFDVIPAGYPNGGMPKYNINDLATNPVYGATPIARAANMANIIANNLPSFYLRDAALSTVGINNSGTPDKILYATRLAANIVDYISPDGTWGATDYSTNMTGVSPQGHGVYPVMIDEMSYVIAGAGASATPSSASTFVNQFWLSVWNPYTTPVTITSANLHISNRPAYYLGTTASTTPTADYNSSVSVISGKFGNGPAPVVVGPNEFVVMGFVPQTNTIRGSSTTSGPVSVNADGPPGDVGPLEQYSLTINGQTTAQSGAMNPGRATPNISGGLQHESEGLSTNYDWESDAIAVWGTEVGDPRFESYYNDAWNNTHDVGTAYTGGSSYWKGVDQIGGSKAWALYIFPSPLETTIPVSTWANRDNIARSPSAVGSQPVSGQTTPDQLTDEYNQANDSNAAPEVVKNAPMVSIGELGHIDDPAYANDILTDVAPRTDGGTFSNPYTSGGGRSLRIGRSEATGSTVAGGTPTANSWDVDGKRGISLLDLFTVNNVNTNAPGTTNSIAQSLMYGGVQGRVNINTASTNVLAALFSQVQITSDPTLVGPSGAPTVLNNISGLVSNVVANRPYSSMSDLYKMLPMFDTNTNYLPNLPMTTAYNNFNWGGGATVTSSYPSTLNVFNRVHQEAFGKLIQHWTVQSRTYRVYVIGQVLDSSQKPHVSVAMEAGIYLQYNQTDAKYEPVIQYVHLLK